MQLEVAPTSACSCCRRRLRRIPITSKHEAGYSRSDSKTVKMCCSPTAAHITTLLEKHSQAVLPGHQAAIASWFSGFTAAQVASSCTVQEGCATAACSSWTSSAFTLQSYMKLLVAANGWPWHSVPGLLRFCTEEPAWWIGSLTQQTLCC